MEFNKQDQFTLMGTDTIMVTSTFDYDALVQRRADLVDIIAKDAQRRADELAQIDALLAQCSTLGIVSKKSIVPITPVDIAPLEK